jgi:xanthine dehydrogenase YagS FAD-binding subunit
MSISTPFEWADATSVDQAVSHIADGNAPKNSPKSGVLELVVLKAGGVDLLDLMKEHLATPKRVVNIRNIEGLDGITDDAKGLKLGPLVTLDRLDTDKTVRGKYPALADAAGKAATPQIRNMATLGGNILQRPRCWYFRHEEFHCRKKGGEICFAQDGENQYHAIFNNQLCAIVHPSATAVPLVAMGASIRIMGPGGKTRDVKLEEFFVLPKDDLHRENKLAPDEIVTEISVPALPAGAKQAYMKQGEKESFDWPIADCVVVLDMNGETCKKASVILGAAAPVPYRAAGAEKALAGQRINADTARAAAQAAVNGATPLSLNGYKVPVFEAVVRRTILKAVGVQA